MKIICIGRNYVDHAKELGNDIPKEPVIFLKPDTCLLRKNQAFFIPDFSDEVHHEVELIVRVNRVGKNIQKKFAHKYYNEIGLGIDFTARDLQKKLRDQGLPWEKSKAFDFSAVISNEFIPITEFDSLNNIEFSLTNNNTVVQAGNSSQMLFDIDEIITQVSKYFTLKIGDLIYTGTPSGVAKVNINDNLVGYIGDKKMFDFRVK